MIVLMCRLFCDVWRRPAGVVCVGLSLLLCGCQSVQDLSLKKLSDNTYEVSVTDETDQAANINALAAASQFCQRLGMGSQTVNASSHAEQGANHFVLVFRCF